MVSTVRSWLLDEKLVHINGLGVKAIVLVLKAFVKTSYKRIKVMFDNGIQIKWPVTMF